MTKYEEAQAAWLNIFGSGTTQPEPVAVCLHVLHILAEAEAAAERSSKAYLDVLLTLAPAVGADRAKELAEELADASRVGHIRYTPGLPLMIDGADCSPENVRRLERQSKTFRQMYIFGTEPDA
jgi:hypothetical protein